MDEDVSKRELPADFNVGCVFRIECELPGNLVYGSRVRLIHVTSDCKMVASDAVDPFVRFDDVDLLGTAKQPKLKRNTSQESLIHHDARMHCTYFRKSQKRFPGDEDIWVITSRFKLREEGEPVYSSDAVMFLSSAIMNAPLGYVIRDADHGFIGPVVGSSVKYSFKIFQLRSAEMHQLRTKSVLSGDFVRLFHQEMGGVMICRVDDEAELESKVAPLGRAIKKHSRPSDDIHAVFIRNESSPDQLSGNSIWQILRVDNLYHGNVTISDTIMLRHAMSGQYLCIKKSHSDKAMQWRLGTSEIPTDDCQFLMRSPDKTSSSPELDSLRDSIQFNQNVSFIHLNSDRTLSCLQDEDSPIEYEGNAALYKNDVALTSSGSRFIKAEVYKLRKVSAEQVQDVLFAARFAPLVRGATVHLQLARSDKLYLPLFRHMCVAMETLVRWLAELHGPDFALLESSKATHTNPDQRIPFSSSLVAWVGLPGVEFEYSDFAYASVQSRESCMTALNSKMSSFRQNCITHSCLLDMLLNFNSIAYTLFHVAQRSLGDPRFVIPIVVNNCCKLIHDLIHVCTLKNSGAALRVLSPKGNLQNLISQHRIMWNPPISAILSTAISSGDDNVIEEVEEHLLDLNEYDIRSFVSTMSQLRDESREAGHILELMNTLAQHGTPKMIKRFQDIIVDECFEVLEMPSFGNSIAGEAVNVSVFFATRYNMASSAWEVSLYDNDFRLRSGKPTRDDFVSYFQVEYNALKEVFDIYDVNKNNYLDLSETFDLLEELGLAGYAFLEELGHRQSTSFEALVKWWWEKRNLYFSTYSATLNNVSFDDVVNLFQNTSYMVYEGGFLSDKLFLSTSSLNLTDAGMDSPGLTFVDVEKHFRNALNSRVRSFRIEAPASQAKAQESFTRKAVMQPVSSMSFLQSTMVSFRSLQAPRGWMQIGELLYSETSDTQWFRRSIQLFQQLCEGKNMGSQAAINKLLPVECLLKVFEDSENLKDKAMICKLISNLFVYHDYVFPTTSLTIAQAHYCGVEETSDTANYQKIGRLFNNHTLFAVRTDSFLLRVTLINFVLSEIDRYNLQLDSDRAADISAYQTALLALVKSLLSIGFFDEDFSVESEKDRLDEQEYLKKLLLKKLELFFTSMNDIESVKFGIKRALQQQLDRGEMSQEDVMSLANRMDKAVKGNLGVELAGTAGKYFTASFQDAGVIDVVESIVDVIGLVFDLRQMASLKNVASLLQSFERIYPELSNIVEYSKSEEVKYSPKLDKKFIKKQYPPDNETDFVETELLMNAFYFESPRLRGKLLSLLQRQLFRADIRKAVETLNFYVSEKESTGRRLWDTLSESLRKYIYDFEALQLDSSSLTATDDEAVVSICHAKLEHRLETITCLIRHMEDIIGYSGNVIKKPNRRTSVFASFGARLSVSSTYAPVQSEASEDFLDEFEGFFSTVTCDYVGHLSSISLDLLRSVSRIIVEIVGDNEYAFKPLETLSLQSRSYIVLIFNFLALLATLDAKSFAEAWIPFDHVVQYLLNFTESADRVMEAIYQYHPDLESLVPPELVKTFKEELSKSFEAFVTWPARILHSMLSNGNRDSIWLLVKVIYEANNFMYFPNHDDFRPLSKTTSSVAPLKSS